MVTFRISRRVAFLVVVAIVVAIPAGSWASHRFSDVPDTNIFHDDIAWLASAEVTRGCNPPDNTEFCPDDAVTRAQMAAFLRRFARYLGAEDGQVSRADWAENADTADTLDGLDSTAFLGSTQKAVDASRLDGWDSYDFLRYGSTVPPYWTLSGVFAAAAAGAGEPAVAAITFYPPLAHDIGFSATQYIAVGDPFTSECPGIGQAATGYFCAYEASNVNMGTPSFLDPASTTISGGVHEEGAVLGYTATGPFPSVRGTWAVTPKPTAVILSGEE